MNDSLKLAFDRLFDEAVKVRIKLFSLSIRGIEVSQATQYHDAAAHLTDPADRGPDNSIPLIAGKSALVRVYVGHYETDLPGVTGTLTVARPGLDGRWTPLAGPAALGAGSVTARAAPAYADERGRLSWTLNFRLPAWLVRGRLRLTAQVSAPDGRSDTMTVDVTAGLLQTLRVRGIPIRYQGPDNAGNPISLARPTLGDFALTAGDAVAMFPVADQPDITLTGDFNWFAPLDGAPDPKDPGGCAPSWNALLYWLNLMKTADGNRSDRIYYGLLPGGTPIGFNNGCGGNGGVGAGLVGDSAPFAHECGHVLGFGHAPCGLTDGDPNDPAYPAYEPYDTPTARMASIGEYGLDTRGPSVLSPNTVRDFMSYCGPGWIGPYHYRALLQHALLDPRQVEERGPRLPDWVNDRFLPELDLPRPGPVEIDPRLIRTGPSAPQRLLTVSALMRNGRLERADLLRLPTRPAALGPVLPGSLVELVDANGELLDRARLRRVPLFGGCRCGCGGAAGAQDDPGFETGLVQAVLPDRDDIASVRLVRDGQPLWSRDSGEGPPRIGGLSATIEGDKLVAAWWVEPAGNAFGTPLQVLLRGSSDDGADWQVLWFGPPLDEVPPTAATVSLAGVRPGRLLVQAVACDGFHTAVSEAVEVEVPARAPTALILWPRDGGSVRCGEPVMLRGMAVAADGSRLPGDALVWELDGRRIGTGHELEGEPGGWEGEHRVVLRARDGQGEAVAEAVFAATCSGEPPRRLRGGGDAG